MGHASDEEQERVFNDAEHPIFSIYTEDGKHIGEVHIAIEASPGDGHISILIGRKDMWFRGYGTASTRAALENAFNETGLYRAWVDIPEYNGVPWRCAATSDSCTRGYSARAGATRGHGATRW